MAPELELSHSMGGFYPQFIDEAQLRPRVADFGFIERFK